MLYVIPVVFGMDSGMLSTFSTHLRDLTIACAEFIDFLQVWASGKVHDLDVLRHRNWRCEGEKIFMYGIFWICRASSFNC